MIRVRDIVLLHFGLNPDDELTRNDVADKTDHCSEHCWEVLQAMQRDGLVQAGGRATTVGRPILYRAGPELLRLIGKPSAATQNKG